MEVLLRGVQIGVHLTHFHCKCGSDFGLTNELSIQGLGFLWLRQTETDVLIKRPLNRISH